MNQFPLKFLYVVFKISLNQKFDQKPGALIHDGLVNLELISFY